jgi:zinc protease
MKTRTFILLFALVSLTLFWGQIMNAAPLKVGSDGYGKGTLSNGITLLFNEDKTTSLTSARILIGGGVTTETAENNGITNLMVNMLFKGNATMTAEQVSSQLDYLGVNFSANCGRDFADISFTCLTENFEKAMEIMAKCLSTPTFPAEELVKLKAEVEGQIKSANDDQSTASSMLFWKTAYGNAGYGLPVLGTLETYSRPTVDQIRAHYDKYVGGNNLILSVATDLPAAQVSTMLETMLGKIKPKVAEIVPPHMQAPTVKEGFISFDRNQSYIFKGFVLERLQPREIAYLNILNQIMGANVGSRLWDLRQKEKLAYDVYSQWITGMHMTGFRAAIGTDTSKVKQALASLDREWNKLMSAGINESELKSAKINMKNSLIYWIDRKAGRANNMAMYEYIGYGSHFILDQIALADQITLDEVNTFVKTRLTPDRIFTSIVGKK